MKLIKKKILTILILILCFSVPILLAIQESKKQSLNATQEILLGFASDVLYRSDKTADQIYTGINKLNASNELPCSDRSISIMRDIDVGSSYIQSIGYVKNNQFVCSSIGSDDFHWDLGPVDFTTSRGTKIRINAPLLGSDLTYIVVEKDNYAVVIHKGLPLETALFKKDISLAVFSLDDRQLYTSRGFIDPKWFNQFKSQDNKTFMQDGYLVAIVKSKKYRIGAIAAIPFSFLNQNTIKTAFILMLVGLIASFIITYLLMYWARIQMSTATALKAALKSKEFFLVYQPIYDVQSGQCVGV